MTQESDAFIHKLKEIEAPAMDEALWSVFYDELKQLAIGRLRAWGGGGTLSATVLVHEVFLKMGRSDQVFKSKEHFLAISSLAMRQIMVNHARMKAAQKRPRTPVTLDLPDAATDAPQLDVILLDRILDELARVDEKMVAIIQARVYGGFSVREVAEALDISPRSVDRAWSKAKILLSKKMKELQ